MDPSSCSEYIANEVAQQGKVDDRGIAALAYNTKLNQNLTFGVGTSFDTQKLNEGTHKVCD